MAMKSQFFRSALWTLSKRGTSDARTSSLGCMGSVFRGSECLANNHLQATHRKMSAPRNFHNKPRRAQCKPSNLADFASLCCQPPPSCSVRRAISCSSVSVSMTQKVVAYCFNLDDENFDMQGSAQAIQLKFSTEPAIFLHEEVFHLLLLQGVQNPGQNSDLFIFKDGSIVLWNVPSTEEATILQLLMPFRSRRHGDDVPPERETMSCAFDSSLSNVSAQPFPSFADPDIRQPQY
jgi:uncharacterized Rmd1/YagE family protein